MHALKAACLAAPLVLSLAATPAVGAAVSTHPVLIGPTSVYGPLNWDLFIESFPFVWNGPAPVDPDSNNVRFEIDFTLTSRFVGIVAPGRVTCVDNIYRFAYESLGRAADQYSPFIMSGVGCLDNTSNNIGLPYDLTDIQHYTQSFTIEVEPDFGFARDAFFLMDGYARTPDTEDATIRSAEFVTVAGQVKITINAVPAPAALPLFALGLAAFTTRRRGWENRQAA